MRSLSAIRTACMLLLASSTALAQSTQPHSAVSPSLQPRTSQDLTVTVDAVAPKSGERLTPANLVVTDNGQRIAPEVLRPVEEYGPQAPAQLLLVIDTLNSSQQEFVRVQTAVTAFLREHGGTLPQPTSIVFLAARVSARKGSTAFSTQNTTALHERQISVHRLAATTDGNTLANNFEEYAKALTAAPDMQSGIAVSERVRLSLEALSFIARAEATVPGAKVTLWLSPGWPYLARSEAKSSAQLFDSVVYFNDALRTARMLLYMIDPQGITNQLSAETNAFQPSSGATLRTPIVNPDIGRDFYQNYVRGVRKPEESNPNDLTLQVLALQTGGLVMQQNNDVKAMLDRCAEDIARLVGVAFRLASSGGVTTYHELRIRSTHPPQTLRARTGFYSR